MQTACHRCAAALPYAYEVGKHSGFACVRHGRKQEVLCYVCAARHELSVLEKADHSGIVELFLGEGEVVNTTGFLRFPIIRELERSETIIGGTEIWVSGPGGKEWRTALSLHGRGKRVHLRRVSYASNAPQDFIRRVDLPPTVHSPLYDKSKKNIRVHIIEKWIYPFVAYVPRKAGILPGDVGERI